MAIDGYYVNEHRTQFDGSALAGENCVPTSIANGADAVTAGRISHSGAYVRSLIPRSDETDPSTPGWSIPDAARAAAKLGLGFSNRSGKGWAAVAEAHDAGLYLVVQGDSDQFSNATCSGAFNGDHCIGVHPGDRLYNGVEQWWIDDPICPAGRWESAYIVRRYAEKLTSTIRFGVFTSAVPKVAAPIPASIPHVVLSAPKPSERNVMIPQGGLTVSSSHVKRLAKGQPIFRHPGGPRVTAMSASGPVPYVGTAGSGWHAVQVRTKGPYADGVARPTVLYVPAPAGPVERRA